MNMTYAPVVAVAGVNGVLGGRIAKASREAQPFAHWYGQGYVRTRLS
jgi:hypothetical protein